MTDRPTGPEDRRPREEVPAEEPPSEADDIISAERTTPHERLVAIAIVAATLAAAVVGYLQVWSSGRADRADSNAQRLAVSSTGSQIRASLWAEVQFEAFTRAAALERRAGQADVEASLFAPDDAPRLRLDGRRFGRLAGRAREFADLVAEQFTRTPIRGALAPEEDPSFPTRFMATRIHEPTRLSALQDAANEAGSGWQSLAASYTAVVTLFAVALYLLGFSLALPPGLSRWFVRGGIAFIAVGGLWAGMVSWERPAEPSEEAASEFASGVVELSTAFDAYDTSGYRRAIEHFDRALEVRPTFARAYLTRGEAVYFEDSPTTGVGTVTSPEALRKAVADLELAEAYGLDSAVVLGDIGALSYQLGLAEGSDALLQQALDYTDRVIAIDPNRPLWLYNRAVMLMALGREGEADAAFDRANEETVRQAPTAHIWTSGALSALELLEHHRPGEAGRILQTKERIIDGVFGRIAEAPPATGQEPVDPLDIRLDISPAILQYVILPPGAASVDPQEDWTAQVWYLDTGDGFAVLPEMSGGPILLQRSVEDGWFALTTFLPTVTPPRCVPNGTYRLELYVNGRLAGSATSEVDFGEMRTVTDQDVNATFCVPSDWVEGRQTIPGVIRDVRSPDGEAGLYIVRAPLPEAVAVEEDPTPLMDVLVRRFARPFTGPAEPKPDTTNFFFLGLDPAAQRRYTYEGGEVLAGVGIDRAEGVVVVAFVYGAPEDAVATENAFLSLTAYQPVPT